MRHLVFVQLGKDDVRKVRTLAKGITALPAILAPLCMSLHILVVSEPVANFCLASWMLDAWFACFSIGEQWVTPGHMGTVPVADPFWQQGD